MVFPTDENVIVGLDRADDAGVYKISDDLALIQTVDFFTPIVDDPYAFGQIAAANALSDVYAMGGTPKTAMNLVAFPVKEMDISILRRIIQGGVDKLTEAGVVLVGGHSIEDKELKFGLSVTGFVHPQRVLTKKNLQAGDRLVLTKPLGTGIVNTAIKGGMAPAGLVAQVTALMARLNRRRPRSWRPSRACLYGCDRLRPAGPSGRNGVRLGQGGAGLFAACRSSRRPWNMPRWGSYPPALTRTGNSAKRWLTSRPTWIVRCGCAFRSPDLGWPADCCTRRPGRKSCEVPERCRYRRFREDR